jgi:SAM-dependent methyltransferase
VSVTTTEFEVTRNQAPPADFLVERCCSICGANDKKQVFAPHLPKDFSLATLHSQYMVDGDSWWHYRVVTCKSCGHLFPDPVLAQGVLEESYRDQEHDNTFGLSEDLMLQTNIGYARQIGAHLTDQRDLFVDIGADTGQFIKACEFLRFKKVVRIEPSKTSVDRAVDLPKNAVLYQKLFCAEDFQPGSVNLATMIHVLDHIFDAGTFLRSVRKIIAPKGIVYAVVHNSQSMIAKISGTQWHPMNLIHYDYYSKATLRLLFEKAGYRVLSIAPTYNSISADQIIQRAPYIPKMARQTFLKPNVRRYLTKVHIRLPLGNIGIVATRD